MRFFNGVILAGLGAASAVYAQEPQQHPTATSRNTVFSVAGEPTPLSGTRLNRHFGVETGVYDREDRDLSKAALRDMERDRTPAVYGVAYAPLGPRTEIFARIGKGGAKTTLAGERDDGWQYGAGAQFNRNGGRSGVRADYVRQGLPQSDIKANIVSVGFMSRF